MVQGYYTQKGNVLPVQAMKAYRGGVEIKLHSFLTSALEEGENPQQYLGN